MGQKTYRFCNQRKWKDFNKKKNNNNNNSLPYLKCVLHLSSVVHGLIYGRFMGFYVNGFLSIWRFTCACTNFKFALTYKCYFPFAVWNSTSLRFQMSKQKNKSDFKAKSMAEM